MIVVRRASVVCASVVCSCVRVCVCGGGGGGGGGGGVVGGVGFVRYK